MVESDERSPNGRVMMSRIFDSLSEKSGEASGDTGLSRLINSWKSLSVEEREQVFLSATAAVASIPVATKIRSAVTRSVRRRRARKNASAVSGSPKKLVAARADDDLTKTAKKRDDEAAKSKKDRKNKKDKKDKKSKKDKKRKKDKGKKGKKHDKKRTK